MSAVYTLSDSGQRYDPQWCHTHCILTDCCVLVTQIKHNSLLGAAWEAVPEVHALPKHVCKSIFCFFICIIFLALHRCSTVSSLEESLECCLTNCGVVTKSLQCIQLVLVDCLKNIATEGTGAKHLFIPVVKLHKGSLVLVQAKLHCFLSTVWFALQSNRMDSDKEYVEVFDDEGGARDKRGRPAQLRRYKDDAYRSATHTHLHSARLLSICPACSWTVSTLASCIMFF